MVLFEGTAGLAALLDGTVLGPPRAGSPRAYGIDSRSLGEGGLFFALPGTRTDGHRFLPALAAAGAWGAVVTDRAAAEAAGLPAVLVADGAAALFALAEARRQLLEYPMVAVTGTNGKTSTKDLLYQLLSRDRSTCRSLGNLNNQLGTPLSLLAAPDDAELGIFELGMSSRGEIDRLARLLRPRFGVITNISLAHIEGLGSLEEVREAKGELIDHLPEDGALYLNADDSCSQYFRERAGGRRVRMVTTRGVHGAAAHFDVKEVSLKGVRGEVVLADPARGRQQRRELLWPIPGRHMVYPLLFALVLAQDLGVEVPVDLVDDELLATLGATPGRMRLRAAGQVQVVDDSYNANPESVRAALDLLEAVEVPGRKFVVLGDMLELGSVSKACHRAVYERVTGAAWLERSWLVGQAFHDVRDESGEFPRNVLVSPSRAGVLEDVRARLQPGDVLLVKGSRGIGLDVIADGVCGPEQEA